MPFRLRGGIGCTINFALIYTPCLSTIATIRTETRSRAFTALAVAWPLGLAWLVSLLFYQAAIRLAA